MFLHRTDVPCRDRTRERMFESRTSLHATADRREAGITAGRVPGVSESLWGGLEPALGVASEFADVAGAPQNPLPIEGHGVCAEIDQHRELEGRPVLGRGRA